MDEFDRSKTSPTLLDRLRDPNDPDAWTLFVDRYGPKIHGWMMQLNAQDADADDVAQEVLVCLYRRMATFEYDPNRGRFRSYLKTLTRNAWSDFVTKRNKQNERIRHVARDALEIALKEEFDLEILEEAERRVQLVVLNRDWQVFCSCVKDEIERAKVAEQHGMTVSAVYMAKKRVQDKLKKEIARLEDDDPKSQEERA